jgi:hypothetical protein
MPSKQLISNLAKDLIDSSGLGNKQKLTFNETQLDVDLLNNLKLALATNSTKRVVEMIFRILAIAELGQKQSIYQFPSSDYLDKIENLEKLSQGNCTVNIPIWMLIATSELIKNKYHKFEFKTIEEVIETLIQSSFDKIQYLWNPQC